MKVTMDNYEEYLLRQVDGELDAEERAALDAFLEAHPACREELAWLEKTRLLPEEPLPYPAKAALYRREGTLPLLRRGWLRYAAAAVLLLLGLFYWRPWAPPTPAPALSSRPAAPDPASMHTIPPAVTPALPAPAHLAQGARRPPDGQAATPAATRRLARRPAATGASLASSRPAAAPRPEPAGDEARKDLPADVAGRASAPLHPLPALADNQVTAAKVDSPALVAASPLAMAARTAPGAEAVGDRILRTAESLNEAKGRMDDALTEKIYDIHDKTSGFLENIQKNGLRIGHITFAINN